LGISIAQETASSQESIPMATPVPMAMLIPKCESCQADLVPGMKFCPHCGEPTQTAGTGNPQDSVKAELISAQRAQPEASSAVPEAPVLPSEISQYYLPVTVARPVAARTLLYQPRLYGAADVVFVDKKKGNKEYRRPYRLLTLPPQQGETPRFAQGERAGDLPSSGSAEPGAHWGEVPESLDKARKLKSLEKAFSDHLYNNARLVLLENSKLGLVGEPGEDVLAFRERCRQAARQGADQELAAEKLKFEPRFLALGVPMPEGASVPGEESLLDVINPLNWFRSAPKPTDKDKINKLHSEWLTKQAAIVDKWKKLGEEYTETTLSPRRQDVQVTAFGLAWAPYWEIDNAGRIERVPAYHQA
jgi:hypothetical protein